MKSTGPAGYQEIWKHHIKDYEFKNVTTDIEKETYSSFDNFNFWNFNISKEEYMDLKCFIL